MSGTATAWSQQEPLPNLQLEEEANRVYQGLRWVVLLVLTMVAPLYFGPLLFNPRLRVIAAVYQGTKEPPGLRARLLFTSHELRRLRADANKERTCPLATDLGGRGERFILGVTLSVATLGLLIAGIWLMAANVQAVTALAIVPVAFGGSLYFQLVFPGAAVWSLNFPELENAAWATKHLLLQGNRFHAFTGELDPLFWANSSLVDLLAEKEGVRRGSVVIWATRLDAMPELHREKVKSEVLTLFNGAGIGHVIRATVPLDTNIPHFQLSDKAGFRLEELHEPWYERPTEERSSVRSTVYLSNPYLVLTVKNLRRRIAKAERKGNEVSS